MEGSEVSKLTGNGWIRTHGLYFQTQELYPPDLRQHRVVLFHCLVLVSEYAYLLYTPQTTFLYNSLEAVGKCLSNFLRTRRSFVRCTNTGWGAAAPVRTCLLWPAPVTRLGCRPTQSCNSIPYFGSSEDISNTLVAQGSRNTSNVSELPF